MKMTDEEAVLTKMGLDWNAPAPGCCGMAGSFGFDEDKYDISIAIGELELLPAVRNAPPESGSRPPDPKIVSLLPTWAPGGGDRHGIARRGGGSG